MEQANVVEGNVNRRAAVIRKLNWTAPLSGPKCIKFLEMLQVRLHQDLIYRELRGPKCRHALLHRLSFVGLVLDSGSLALPARAPNFVLRCALKSPLLAQIARQVEITLIVFALRLMQSRISVPFVSNFDISHIF